MEFRDLRKQYQLLKPEINSAVERIMENTDFISGKEVKVLEAELEEYVGVKHCITCGNGTDALMLALMAWNIGEGDAVFVPNFTFFASGEAPAFCGATPVFVDVDRETFNISPEALEQAICQVIEKKKLCPRVIIAVDLFGQPADFIAIRCIADKYHLLVLEDGAQGFGGSIVYSFREEKKACSFGDISTTSFFPAKPLGCYGDGGAIFTDNNEWAEIIRSLCVHGKGKDKYDNIRIGINSRLDTIQAAVLRVKLKQFQEYELKQSNKIAQIYTELLKNKVVTPVVLENFISCWAQYTVVCNDNQQRKCIHAALKKADIPSMIYYAKGMHEQKAFGTKCMLIGSYQNTRYLTERVLSLPMHPYLKIEQIKHIVEIIEENINSKRGINLV